MPLKRYAEKDEIADLALFLATEAARNITGAVIPSDGGNSVLGAGRMIETAVKAAMGSKSLSS